MKGLMLIAPDLLGPFEEKTMNYLLLCIVCLFIFEYWVGSSSIVLDCITKLLGVEMEVD